RAGLAYAVEIFGEDRNRLRIGREEGVFGTGHEIPVPAGAVDLLLAHGNERPARPHAGHDLSRQRTGRDAHRGLACGGASAAAIIAQAVFDLIGVVGMAGTVAVGDLAVILGTLIDILDHHGDRRTGRDHG